MSGLVKHGWKIFFYQAFAEIYDGLHSGVEAIEKNQPTSFVGHPKVKLFKRIQQVIFEEIPQNPGHAQYNLGNTLGTKNRHWRRAKFLDRFRLFFRYHSAQKIIVYAWVNDETTPRRAGSKKDPYVLFEKRLLQDDPPSDWDDLVKRTRK